MITFNFFMRKLRAGAMGGVGRILVGVDGGGGSGGLLGKGSLMGKFRTSSVLGNILHSLLSLNYRLIKCSDK